MNRLSRLVAMLLTLAASPMVMAAAGPGPREDVSIALTVTGVPFTAIALNTSQTFDATQVSGLRFVTLFADYVFGAGTAVNMTCVGGPTSTTIKYKLQTLTQAAGVLTSADAQWTKSTGSASQAFTWTIATNAYAYIKCTVSAAGSPTVSDTLTLTAIGSVY